jgi:putative ABC transport system permease protein
VTVAPLPEVALTAFAAALAVTLAAAYWPARRASQLDPCVCFKEI